MINRFAVACVLLVSSLTVAAGDKPPCKTNFKQEGGFMGGRTFTTWDVVPVAPAVAFKRIHLEGVKSGLQVGSSDKESGTIVFSQVNAGVVANGAQVSVPWNVLIEPEGKGSKITVTKSTPGGFSTSKDFQMTSMCAVIDAARDPAKK
ncbi:MAG: hypothetical protein E6Q88_12370 [Lysobacteraceae bacterium]|nr:MAG: hypothetical protein E6Q88_12370 [Xanthomonadaceae bacterium]